MKSSIKRLRGMKGINAVATSTVRAGLRATRTTSGPAERHLPRVGTSSSRLPNGRVLRMWSQADDKVANRLYWRGWRGYEPEVAARFFELASHSRVTLDIGAHGGFYSLLASHANPDGRVFAFEPYPPVFARLQANIRLNQAVNIDAHRTAVGSSSGHADLFYVRGIGLPSSSSLSLEFMESLDPAPAQLSVETLTLDDFAQTEQVRDVDLVKIDTESTESEVISGMLGILRQSRPHVFCEILPTATNLAELSGALTSLGYAFHQLGPDGAQPRSVIVPGAGEWRNYLFSPT